MPMLAFAHSKRGRQFPSGTSFHVKLFFCAFARANVHCRRWRKRRAKVTSALLLSENCRDLLLFVTHIIFLSHAIFVRIVRVVYFCGRPFMTQTASKIIFHRTMQTLKTILFLLLAAFMIYAGVSHLTFHRLDFVAEVPMWLRFSDGFTDFVVLASGVVEIVLGLSDVAALAPQSQDRRPVGSFLCAGFSRQPQSVYLPHRRIWFEHRHAPTHSPLLPADTHRVGALVHGWLECL